MSKKIILQSEFSAFIDSLENSSLNDNQQLLLGTFGGGNLDQEDTVINNNVQGCEVSNNCNGGNCVAGCGKK